MKADYTVFKDAQAAIDTPKAAKIVFDDTSFVGTIVDATSYGQLIEVIVVGGTGGLSRPRTALHMGRNVVLRDVARELLRGVGETLTGSSDASLLSKTVDAYQLLSDVRVGTQLGGMCRRHGGRWFVALDGSVTVRDADRWDPIQPHKDYTRHQDGGGDGRSVYTFAKYELPIRPGSFEDDVIEYVQTEWRDGLYTLTLAPYDVADAIVELASPRATYDARFSRSYAARINSQNDDGSFDVTPDDASIAGDGLARVPYRTGGPGLTYTEVAAGTRCVVAFEDGDPSRPFVAAWAKENAREFLMTIGPPDTSSWVPREDHVQRELNRLRDELNAHIQHFNDHLNNEFALHVHPHSLGPTSPTTTVPAQDRPMDPIEETRSNHARVD